MRRFRKQMSLKKIFILFMAALLVFFLAACENTGEKETGSPPGGSKLDGTTSTVQSQSPVNEKEGGTAMREDFVLISGGTFQVGSPETEAWRSDDENLHTVTVSDFYICRYELTQAEYEQVMGSDPSNFSGEKLPVENISWLDAVAYCNTLSQAEGLTPVYTIDGERVTWDRGANGYRLPTEAEWEYACRAGTVTPFNTETSISPEESNYYGHYPYEIEDHYFSQGALTTKPGQYRQTTVNVDSFSPNGFGLYNMHGNVGEWVWDYYGEYPAEEQTDPAKLAPDSLMGEGLSVHYSGGSGLPDDVARWLAANNIKTE